LISKQPIIQPLATSFLCQKIPGSDPDRQAIILFLVSTIISFSFCFSENHTDQQAFCIIATQGFSDL
jgi:hypothetical protein